MPLGIIGLWEVPVIKISHPSLNSLRATAKPIPLVPPVTKALYFFP